MVHSCFERYHSDVFVDNFQKLWVAFDGLELGRLNAQNPWTWVLTPGLRHIFSFLLKDLTGTLTLYFYSVFTLKVEFNCLIFMLHAVLEWHSYLMKRSFKKGRGTSAASALGQPRSIINYLTVLGWEHVVVRFDWVPHRLLQSILIPLPEGNEAWELLRTVGRFDGNFLHFLPITVASFFFS